MSNTNQLTSPRTPLSPTMALVRRVAALAGVLVAIAILCNATGFPPDSQAAPADFSFDSWTTAEPQVMPDPQVMSVTSIQDADREDVAFNLQDTWVVQLASQAQGENDEAYLIEHQELNNTCGAYLTTTDDYSYSNNDGVTYWVTLLSTPFGSEIEAEQWCASQGLTSSDCLTDFLNQ